MRESYIPPIVVPLIRELKRQGYPIAFQDTDNDEEVMNAAQAFFENADVEFYLPMETDGWNETFDFGDPRAWADPEGKTGPDGMPLSVDFGGVKLSRRRAAYLLRVFMSYRHDLSEIGTTAKDLRAADSWLSSFF